MSLPTSLAPVVAFVVPEEQMAILPAYTRRLLAEADAIAAAIPHDQLAVQWDVAVEVALLAATARGGRRPARPPSPWQERWPRRAGVFLPTARLVPRPCAGARSSPSGSVARVALDNIGEQGAVAGGVPHRQRRSR